MITSKINEQFSRTILLIKKIEEYQGEKMLYKKHALEDIKGMIGNLYDEARDAAEYLNELEA